MERFIFISLLIVVVSGDPCPDGLSTICTNCSFYHEDMGCLYADPSEEDKYDNYGQALQACRNIMGNKSVLAEALNEEQQNILASLMKEAEKYFMDPVLSYWMSGLQRDGDDAPSWTWAHSGQKVPPSYSDWNEAAVPNITGHRLNCMQYLSGTAFDGEWMTFDCSNDFIQVHPLCQLPN